MSAAAEFPPQSHDAEQRRRQAETLESVGRLTGGVAHDFNNILTGVLLYCDLLLASLEPGHRGRRYAEEIRSAGLQATGLVRQLLLLARPSPDETTAICLNEIVEGMRGLLDRLIGENVELSLYLEPNLGLIRIERAQARQILLNLVLNARDAMPDGGRVRVETRNCRLEVLPERSANRDNVASLPCVLFVVEDNGRGMDANTRSHLFEALFTTKDPGKGTGLGLATVQDIVSSHGGLIHVDSAPGRGTRVTVILPLFCPAPETSLQPEFSSETEESTP